MANQQVELIERLGVEQAHTNAGRRELVPMGACHWCNEPLRRPNQLFCDEGCAADHADDKRRNGVMR
ncbi:hypothetical protein [Thiobacillus denitrificans]|nr:hypothetical protein [Thiobacillus denitrificans]